MRDGQRFVVDSAASSWIRSFLSEPESLGVEVSLEDPGVQFSEGAVAGLIDSLVLFLLERAAAAPTFNEARLFLVGVEAVASEAVRFITQTDAAVSDLTLQVIRDFDRGDEGGEFRRIYCELRHKTYFRRHGGE